LRNFTAIMGAYRGEHDAIATARLAHQQDSIEQAGELIDGVNSCRQQCRDILSDANSPLLDFSNADDELKQALTISEQADYQQCDALIANFDAPAPKLADLIEQYKTTMDADKKAMIAAEKASKKKDIEQRKQLDAKNKLLRELSAVLNNYHAQFTASSVGEPLQDYKQSIQDWNSLLEQFPDDKYQDIEGLCKIVDLEEVAENDYSLTPGRYVGYSITIDEDFDYQGRMAEIHQQLAGLNAEANELMGFIHKANV